MKIYKIDMTKIASQIVEEELEQLEQLGTQDIVFSDKFYEKMSGIVSKKESKKGWGVKTAWVAGILIFFLLQTILCGTIFKDVIIAAQIDYNLAKLEDLKLEQLISPDPYAYVDNENYKNIVNMGTVAIEILDTKYQQGEITGKSAWIAGILIEDISGIKLSNITGNEWKTGTEFFKSWDSVIQSIPQKFGEISNSSLTLDEKAEVFRDYGIFGKYFINCIEQCETKEMDFLGNTICITSWKNYEFLEKTLSYEELDIIEKYLKNKINMK